MSTFIETCGINAAIETLLRDTKGDVYIVSPFLKFCNRFKDDMIRRNEQRYETYIIYGKTDLQPDVSHLLRDLKFVHVRYCEDLHAKCYCNRSVAIITSMNLYEYSQINNEEMGLIVCSKDEPETFEKILNSVYRLMSKSGEVELSTKKSVPKKSKSEYTVGHCIRCGSEIPMNVLKPYCDKCFKSWNKYHDAKYVEKDGFCHLCGHSNPSTLEKPVCRTCFIEHKGLFMQ